MKKLKALEVQLPDDEYFGLLESADDAVRSPSDQARVAIRQTLEQDGYIDDEEKRKAGKRNTN